MSGEGPPASPVALELQIEHSEILTFDGTICGVGGGWKTTAEEDLIVSLETHRAMSLEGDFQDGRFTGSLAPSPYAVVAIRDDR